MNWIAVGKGITSFVVSAGVGTVVKNAIKATTPADLSRINKVLVYVGGAVITSMISDKACQYVEGAYDEFVKAYKEARYGTSDDNKKGFEEPLSVDDFVTLHETYPFGQKSHFERIDP